MEREEEIMKAFERGETEFEGTPILQALGSLVMSLEVQRVMKTPLNDQETNF